MPKSWYEVKAAGDVPEIRLYGRIGDYDISADEFVGALVQIKAPTIDLFIDSPGGNAYQGVAIYNAMLRHPASIRATVDGLAASAASVILQGARGGRKMGTGSTLMIHKPWSGAIGGQSMLLKVAEELGKLGDSIAEIYALHAGGKAADWLAAMGDESWYRADEAVAAGLADGTVPTQPKNAVYDFSNLGYRKIPEWLHQVPYAAGRTMSAGNLGQLHTMMAQGDALHTAVCDMGADCPLAVAGARAQREAPRDNAKPTAVPSVEDWPYLEHHGLDGSVDARKLVRALSRAQDLNIRIERREERLAHLKAHARQGGEEA